MSSNDIIPDGRPPLDDNKENPQNFDVFPWSIDPRGEAFFAPLKVDWERWDKFYPYRLLVINARTKETIVRSGQGRESVHTLLGAKEAGFEYVLTQNFSENSWELNLPITPQQLRITDSFAINTSATARGVIEEHGGVRFKNIIASGTCGIWARRDTRAVTPIQSTSLESIFSGTIDNLKNLKKIGTQLFSKGGYPASTSPAVKPEKSSGGKFSTGYFQALYLGQFLERYAQEKKKPENRHWRLVFHMPKNNDAYIVTPVSFVGDRNANRPQEYMWSMQLKAWKRIELDSPKPIQGTIPTLDANTFQRVLNTISGTRSLLASATNTVKAIRSDFARTFNVLRQTALAVKDTAGFIRTVADLPSQVISDAKSSIEDALSITNSSFKKDLFSEGLSSNAVAAGALGLGAIQLQQLSANNSIFENPEENFDLLDTVPVDSLALTPEQLNAIDDEQESISLLTTDDFVQFRSELLSLALDISNNFGAGSEQYSQTYGRPVPKTRVTPITLEENDILISLYETIQAYDLLTVKKTFDDFKSVNSLDYVGGLADQSGISFDIATSKFMVPVPFGLTIEELAARYLSDSNKWVEIVTINNLKPPYIDEIGFFYDMISNAEGRQLNVDDNQGKLYVGQKIIISSDTVPAFTRKIISIEKIDDDNFLINVDGLANLDNLTIVDNAKIHAYLPGTVNSQNQIYIPINVPSQADDRIRTPSHLDEDALTRISGIDFLLTDDGDIAINSVGDFRLANGLTNLVQALKLKIKTKKGTLLRHLDFGLGISPGISAADINNGTLFLEMNKIIQDDSRFSGIDRLTIKMNGPIMLIDMAVKISNGSGIVPITFEV